MEGKGTAVRTLVVIILSVVVFWVIPRTETTRYVLMIDAGSTGSRIHMFQFDKHRGNDTPELKNGWFEQLIPGLSSYESPELAAKSLDPLLDRALEVVPEKYHSKATVLAVRATAGLRLLSPKLRNDILENVYNRLSRKYPFKVADVTVMDGKEEGVNAWLTVNFLLGNLNNENSSTAAIFDLGGASTQIVFEPDFAIYTDMEAKNLLIHGDHRYNFKFGEHEHVLYQHSYLGYGLMEARKRIHREIYNNSTLSYNPCISAGQKRPVKIDQDLVEMTGPNSSVTDSSADTCISFAREILNLDTECRYYSCGFDGVHQPSLTETFTNEDIYIVSYFYDRVFQLGLTESFTVESIKHLTDTVCMGKSSWEQHFTDSLVLQELINRPEWCLDLAFIFTILHYGYGLPLDRQLTVANKVNNYELSWALGASLRLLQELQIPEIYPTP